MACVCGHAQQQHGPAGVDESATPCLARGCPCPDYRREASPGVGPDLPFAVRLVEDPLEGWLLMAAGQAPLVARVARERGALGGYHLDPIEGEWPKPTGTLWPAVIPWDFVGYPGVMVVPVKSLMPVDLLRIISGRRFGHSDATDAFYLWQEAGRSLTVLSEKELRKALASPWLRYIRGDDGGEAKRGIALRG